MAAVDIGARDVPPMPVADDLDDLFNYDIGDVFRDVDTNIDVPTQQKPPIRANGQENAAGLGIDEEVKVARKRAPIPKLDLDRLLGPAGIPKLRRITKCRLKFKGKGHEYSDVSKLLSTYQLWLDELYPRAKFADGLAMIEKLGHSKRMQTMRREWINDGKSKDTLEVKEHQTRTGPISQPLVPSNNEPLTTTNRSQSPSARTSRNALPAVTTELRNPPERIDFPPENLFVLDDEDLDDRPLDDDLDALLAEEKPSERNTATLPTVEVPRVDDDFNDEMEAMAGMEDMW